MSRARLAVTAIIEGHSVRSLIDSLLQESYFHDKVAHLKELTVSISQGLKYIDSHRNNSEEQTAERARLMKLAVAIQNELEQLKDELEHFKASLDAKEI